MQPRREDEGGDNVDLPAHVEITLIRADRWSAETSSIQCDLSPWRQLPTFVTV